MNPPDGLADDPAGVEPLHQTPGDFDAAPGLANDWVTIWQSELAALAVDRESAEHMRAAMAGWFAATASLRRSASSSASVDPARPDAPPRSAAAAAPPDAGDAVLRAGLAGLERRLAELERRLDAADTRERPAKPRSRKSRSTKP